MFGIGPTELIVILVIALLVLGPKRLPELASGLGKGLAEFRRATADLNAELDQARKTVEEPAKEATKAVQDERRVSRRGPTPTSAAGASAGVDEDDDAEDDEDDESDENPKASA